jgi:hypothetical protein
MAGFLLGRFWFRDVWVKTVSLAGESNSQGLKNLPGDTNSKYVWLLLNYAYNIVEDLDKRIRKYTFTIAAQSLLRCATRVSRLKDILGFCIHQILLVRD